MLREVVDITFHLDALQEVWLIRRTSRQASPSSTVHGEFDVAASAIARRLHFPPHPGCNGRRH